MSLKAKFCTLEIGHFILKTVWNQAEVSFTIFNCDFLQNNIFLSEYD